MTCDVVTLGHVLVDIRVLVDRFATPDTESKILDVSYSAGGSAANTAVGVVRLGHRASVIAKVGLDNFGRIVLEELSIKGVDVGHVRAQEGGDTGFTIVIIDSSGEIVMYGYKGVSEELRPDEVDLDLIAGARALHVASLRLDTSLKAAKHACEHGLLVTWDPGRRLARLGLGDEQVREMLRNIDVLLVNRVEARVMTGVSDYREAAKLLLGHGPEAVVVKLGGEGAYVVTADRELHVPAFKVRAVDTTGAGDSFAAGLIVKLLEGEDLEGAVRYANAVAALKVTRLGAQAIPYRDEVEVFVKRHRRLGEVFSSLLGRELSR